MPTMRLSSEHATIKLGKHVMGVLRSSSLRIIVFPCTLGHVPGKSADLYSCGGCLRPVGRMNE